MFDKFRMDVARWIVPAEVRDPSEVTAVKTIKLLYRHLALRAVMWYRIGNWCKRKKIPGLPGMIQRLIYKVHGLEIKIGAPIGGGLYIAHPIGTVLSPHSMGENCSIIAAVTVGMRNEWAFPRLGNNVFIGAGARVLGGIQIGDDTIIGANAVVIKDVPAGGTAVGIPARVVRIDPAKTQAPVSS